MARPPATPGGGGTGGGVGGKTASPRALISPPSPVLGTRGQHPRAEALAPGSGWRTPGFEAGLSASLLSDAGLFPSPYRRCLRLSFLQSPGFPSASVWVPAIGAACDLSWSAAGSLIVCLSPQRPAQCGLQSGMSGYTQVRKPEPAPAKLFLPPDAETRLAFSSVFCLGQSGAPAQLSSCRSAARWQTLV